MVFNSRNSIALSLVALVTVAPVFRSQRRAGLGEESQREANSGDDERDNNEPVSGAYIEALRLVSNDGLDSKADSLAPIYIVTAANAQGVSTDTVIAMLREDNAQNQPGCYELANEVCRSCPYQGAGSGSIVLKHYGVPAGPCGKEPSN